MKRDLTSFEFYFLIFIIIAMALTPSVLSIIALVKYIAS